MRGGVYWWVLGAQVLLLLAALGSRLAGGRIRLLAVPHYYLLVTAATLIALFEVATRGVAARLGEGRGHAMSATYGEPSARWTSSARASA